MPASDRAGKILNEVRELRVSVGKWTGKHHVAVLKPKADLGSLVCAQVNEWRRFLQ